MPLGETSSNTTVQYTVTTTNTADGTTLYWKTTGNVSNSDIVGGNTGSIVVTNNRAIFNVTIFTDTLTEGVETIGIAISTGSLNGPTVVSTANLITINDTSLDPAPERLYSWGQNDNGQLGQNNRIASGGRSSPVQVGTDTTWDQISTQEFAVIATKTNGTLWSWGSGNGGGLGLNNTVDRSSPTQVGALTTWSKVVKAKYFTLAIKTDGTLWSFGKNGQGQLGLGDVINRSSPVQVGSATNWSLISAGNYMASAIKTDGTLWMWGQQVQGSFGLNESGNVYKSSPTQVGSGTTWSQVSSGPYSWMATQTNGTLWLCGYNNYGHLGFNDTVDKSSPVQLGAGTDWSKISHGFNSSLATKTNGTLWAWGRNHKGQLGRNIAYTTNSSSPVQVGSSTTWSLIDTDSGTVLATKTDGTLWVWGTQQSGVLGLNAIVGSYTDGRSSPIQVGAATTWSKISTGGFMSIAITSG
jgi:alpha-tubulin suppressor-like RCC1 family protein